MRPRVGLDYTTNMEDKVLDIQPFEYSPRQMIAIKQKILLLLESGMEEWKMCKELDLKPSKIAAMRRKDPDFDQVYVYYLETGFENHRMAIEQNLLNEAKHDAKLGLQVLKARDPRYSTKTQVNVTTTGAAADNRSKFMKMATEQNIIEGEYREREPKTDIPSE